MKLIVSLRGAQKATWQLYFLLLVFFANSLGLFPLAQAEEIRLPMPGSMVELSPNFNPPILKGLKVNPKNPFKFDFIMDVGAVTNRPNTRAINNRPYNEEAIRLIKYFLASLTIPEKDLWVNLSPYEKNRIVPEAFGKTEMGRNLLAQDYILKQITSSLMYPEGETGKKFWKRVYVEAAQKFGTTNIPVNTFNKVWIVPEKAMVYENAKSATAYVVGARLKVMLERDYLALQKNKIIPANTVILSEAKDLKGPYDPSAAPQNDVKAKSTLPLAAGYDISSIGVNIVKEIIIPELTKEVNEGQNFAQLRQVYNSLILATWYKKKIKDSILAQVYEDKNKIKGIEYPHSIIVGARFIASVSNSINRQSGSINRTPTANDIELIYRRYLQAFKQGAYNYIKEEQDPITHQSFPRKYFSGGLGFVDMAMRMQTESTEYPIQGNHDVFDISVALNPAMRPRSDKASISSPDHVTQMMKVRILDYLRYFEASFGIEGKTNDFNTSRFINGRKLSLVLQGELEGEDVLGTHDCFSCAPIVVYESKGSNVVQHIFHFVLIGSPHPNSVDLAEHIRDFFKEMAHVSLQNSIVIIPYDLDYHQTYMAIAHAVRDKYPSSKVLTIPIEEYLVKAGIILKEGVGIATSNMVTSDRQYMALTWDEIHGLFRHSPASLVTIPFRNDAAMVSIVSINDSSLYQALYQQDFMKRVLAQASGSKPMMIAGEDEQSVRIAVAQAGGAIKKPKISVFQHDDSDEYSVSLAINDELIKKINRLSIESSLPERDFKISTKSLFDVKLVFLKEKGREVKLSQTLLGIYQNEGKKKKMYVALSMDIKGISQFLDTVLTEGIKEVIQEEGEDFEKRKRNPVVLPEAKIERGKMSNFLRKSGIGRFNTLDDIKEGQLSLMIIHAEGGRINGQDHIEQAAKVKLMPKGGVLAIISSLEIKGKYYLVLDAYLKDESGGLKYQKSIINAPFSVAIDLSVESLSKQPRKFESTFKEEKKPSSVPNVNPFLFKERLMTNKFTYPKRNWGAISFLASPWLKSMTGIDLREGVHTVVNYGVSFMGFDALEMAEVFQGNPHVELAATELESQTFDHVLVMKASVFKDFFKIKYKQELDENSEVCFLIRQGFVVEIFIRSYHAESGEYAYMNMGYIGKVRYIDHGRVDTTVDQGRMNAFAQTLVDRIDQKSLAEAIESQRKDTEISISISFDGKVSLSGEGKANGRIMPALSGQLKEKGVEFWKLKSANDLPSRDGQVSVILASNVVDHMTNTDKAGFKRIVEIKLKLGGILITSAAYSDDGKMEVLDIYQKDVSTGKLKYLYSIGLRGIRDQSKRLNFELNRNQKPNSDSFMREDFLNGTFKYQYEFIAHDRAMRASEAMALSDMMKNGYVLDRKKAKDLAEDIRGGIRFLEKDQEGWDVYVNGQGNELVKVSPLGTRRFFDREGHWIMTVDPFGHVMEKLKYNKKGEVVFIEGRLPSGFKFRVRNFKHTPGESLVSSETDWDHGVLIIENSVEDLFKEPGRIPNSYGAERISNEDKGAGVILMNILSRFLKDYNLKHPQAPKMLKYVGNYPLHFIYHSLMDVGKIKSRPDRPFLTHQRDYSWEPAPFERIYNEKSNIYVHVRDHKIARAVLDAGGWWMHYWGWENAGHYFELRADNVEDGQVIEVIDLLGNIINERADPAMRGQDGNQRTALTDQEIGWILQKKLERLNKLEDVLIRPWGAEADLYAVLRGRTLSSIDVKSDVVGKDVLVIPGYANNAFIIAEAGAKSVTVYDKDPVTIAWVKAIKKYYNYREGRYWNRSQSIGEMWQGMMLGKSDKYGVMIEMIMRAVDFDQRHELKGNFELAKRIDFHAGTSEAIVKSGRHFDTVYVPYLLGVDAGIQNREDIEAFIADIMKVAPGGRLLITPIYGGYVHHGIRTILELPLLKNYIGGFDNHWNLAVFNLPDAAMVNENGGIDLSSVQIAGAGNGIKFDIDPAAIRDLQDVPGFVPVIINIRPITNLRQFLDA